MPSLTVFKPKNGDHNGLFGRLSEKTPEPPQPHKHLRETTAEKKVPARRADRCCGPEKGARHQIWRRAINARHPSRPHSLDDAFSRLLCSFAS